MSASDIAMDHTCPWCSTVFDRVMAAIGDDAMPAPGDVTICIECGEFALFDSAAPGGLRKPTDTEVVEIVDDPDMRRLRAAWVAMEAEQ